MLFKEVLGLEKTKQQLKSSADGQTKKLQTAAATALTADATALKENIKDVIDITKDNYIPNIAEINDLLEKSVNLDAQLKNNGKKGLDSEIQDLTNALDVFNYMANFRTAPMDDLVAEYNAVKNNNVVTYQTDKIPSDVTVPKDAKVTSEFENGDKLTRRKLNSAFDESKTYVS